MGSTSTSTSISNPFHRAIYLTGPTASGKTAAGVVLARHLDAEIIALDSMTLYRGLDIGTAKPGEDDRGGVPHHLIDVLDPWETSSVADYLERARQAIGAIEARGRRALFVGGTPMYLKAALRGLFEGPPADPAIRQELEGRAEREGDAALHRELAAIDPDASRRIHPNDLRRVVRALEVFRLTGTPLSTLQREHDRAAEGVTVLMLDPPRPALHHRIDRRVEAMIEDGLVAEVAGLIAGPRPLSDTARQAVGYAEMIEHLNGQIDLPTAVSRTQARTRQFAKRQITWFRGLPEVRPVPVAPDEASERVAGRLLTRIDPASLPSE
jgi:tRNA dimethylallyltransferase